MPSSLPHLQGSNPSLAIRSPYSVRKRPAPNAPNTPYAQDVKKNEEK
jgi:hypothetical protein